MNESSGATPARLPPHWIEVAAGPAFTVRAPAGTRYESGRGTDSAVGTIVGPGFSLSSDYGLYSDPLDADPKQPGRRSRQVTIDGRRATIVSDCAATGAPHHGCFSGIHFPEVQPGGMGPLRLTLTATLDDPAKLALVEQVYATIRFTEAAKTRP